MKRVVLAWLFLVVGCGHGDGDIDELVGESCTDDRDCEERCFQGGDFPGGFCSLACQTDNDCPDDTFCMSESGGVCMFACPAFDCTRLGPEWECRDRSRQNGGDERVCSGS